jgi:hypothetical protein
MQNLKYRRRKMSKKSLIIYASWGGNTEKVALRFKQVFEKFSWECDVLKVTRRTDVHNPPYRLDDYDLVCVGSLVVNGIPVKEIFDDHLGIMMPHNLFRDPDEGFGMISEGWRRLKGIVFVTYGGTRWGPPEAIPSLACLENRLQDMRIRCIGKFSCAGGGKGGHGFSFDKLADAKGWGIEEAAGIISRYRENPNHPEFANLSMEDRELLDETVASRQKEDEAPGPERSHSWHWPIANRPNERDLMKAEIFLEEILEDFYGEGIDANGMAQYVCIA